MSIEEVIKRLQGCSEHAITLVRAIDMIDPVVAHELREALAVIGIRRLAG